MKLSKLNDLRFKAAFSALTKQAIPLSTAFKLKGINLVVNEQLRGYEDSRMAALHKYGQKNEDGSFKTDEGGNVFFETVENAQGFADEINKLLGSDVELPEVGVNELGSNILISSEDLLMLEFVVQ